MQIADLVLQDLPADFPVEVAGPVEALRGRAAQLLRGMTPRVRLSNGRLGYRAKGKTTIDVRRGWDSDLPLETIELAESDTEIEVLDPVLTLDGALRLDMEICSYVAEGTSKVLFDGEPIRLVLGRDSDPTLPPSYGRLEIPLGVDFPDVPVVSVQKVFVAAETPIGRLTNREPAIMKAFITRIPPIGIFYEQEGDVPLSVSGDVIGDLVIKAMTRTALTQLLP